MLIIVNNFIQIESFSILISTDGTTTTLPVDTMNLMVDPTNEMPGGSLGGGASVTGPASAVGKEEGPAAEGEEPSVMPPEVKLMLFPSQVHKLTSLLSLLAHLRDLVQVRLLFLFGFVSVTHILCFIPIFPTTFQGCVAS